MLPPDLYTGSVRHPRDVAAWVREAGDQPVLNRGPDPHHDDGDRAGGLLGRTGLGGPNGNEEVRLETHQFRREGRGSLLPPLRPPALDDEVLALDIPVLPQPLHRCLPVRTCPLWGNVGRSFLKEHGVPTARYPIR